MKMEMSIKLICRLFAVAFLLLWSKKVDGFFLVRKEKNRYREAHRADCEVGRRGAWQAGCGSVTPSARKERAWEWTGGSMAFPGMLWSGQLRLH